MLLAHETGPRLRIAVVGCGSHAYRSLFPSFDYVPVELVATCDLNRERAQTYARHFGATAVCGSLEEVIARGDVQGVVLAVGAKQHPDLACQALAAGLHVWMEKPPAIDVAGIDRMIAAQAAAANRPAVVVGFKKAFMPITQRMKQFLADPRFGPIRTVMGRFPMDVPGDGLVALAEGRQSNWLANGVHALSPILELAGRPESLTVHRAGLGGGFVTMDFPDGAVGCLHLAEGQARTLPMERYEVICRDGHLINENNVRLLVGRPGYTARYFKTCDFTEPAEDEAALVYEPQHTLSMLENKAIFLQGFVQELDHWASCALSGTAPTTGTLAFARSVMECYEAALHSTGGTPRGATIRLDDLPANRKA